MTKSALPPIFRELERRGHEVHEFGSYHYRVDRHFDIFPNNRGRAWKWIQPSTGSHGELDVHILASLKVHADAVEKTVAENPKPAGPLRIFSFAPSGVESITVSINVDAPSAAATLHDRLKAMYFDDSTWDQMWEVIKANLKEGAI